MRLAPVYGGQSTPNTLNVKLLYHDFAAVDNVQAGGEALQGFGAGVGLAQEHALEAVHLDGTVLGTGGDVVNALGLAADAVEDDCRLRSAVGGEVQVGVVGAFLGGAEGDAYLAAGSGKGGVADGEVLGVLAAEGQGDFAFKVQALDINVALVRSSTTCWPGRMNFRSERPQLKSSTK